LWEKNLKVLPTLLLIEDENARTLKGDVKIQLTRGLLSDTKVHYATKGSFLINAQFMGPKCNKRNGNIGK